MLVSRPSVLQMSSVSVFYGERIILKDVDLSIPIPGVVGIVGGSGAGKSTLVHAIMGLVPAASGSIRLGKYELSATSLGAWRGTIGYVSQETILFHESVRDNLLLGHPQASEEELVAAARRAHAHDFIVALPAGYETLIGDQGVMLSGGQRQRLGIARALLARPLILLMDEPTSALDPESEREILAALEELRNSIGILIVAHRLATVRGADCICVLEGGRVVESGSWSKLIAQRTRLHDLARAQYMTG
jgi:ABC-type multidrug transport system fused ATPase/permease subunit